MRTATLIKKIEQVMVNVAKERDKLDDLIDTATSLKEDCDNAYDAMQQARDALSELV